ncbi:substrate-binding periplasmic protein [Aliagarivorans marinus]|uniref:substrate-binding periplasmic protein n=1 Tax=Aliagarivorans marinus TaxID=561965 RepID=UPI000686C6C3|nr:transporter substrate-binding domain-containing protein [Aliagarivorans marinus]
MGWLKRLSWSLALMMGYLPAMAEPLVMLTHYLKPFSYQEHGRRQGLAVEQVEALVERMGVAVEYRVVPFARGLRMVQTQSNTALFIVARRPEREDTVKWVGPLISSGVYFYQRRGRDLKLASLEQLREQSLSIGVQIGNADHHFLLEQGFSDLHLSNNQRQCMEMLYRGRIDLAPISEHVIGAMAEDAGISETEFENTGLKLYQLDVYTRTTSRCRIQRNSMPIERGEST